MGLEFVQVYNRLENARRLTVTGAVTSHPMLAKSRRIAAPVLPAGDCQVAIQKSKNSLAIAGARRLG